MDWNNKPLFVLGYSKSGTSLMVALLDHHPQLVVIPEETDFVDILYSFCVYLESQPALRKGGIEVIMDMVLNKSHIRNFKRGKVDDDIGGNFDYSKLNNTIFETTLRKTLNEIEFTVGNVFKSLSKAYHEATVADVVYDDVKYWVEKTPYHEIHLKNRKVILDRMFSNDYKIIHIIRDPRDNYMAYKKKHPNLTVYEFCYEWRRVLRIASQFKGQDRFKYVKYEDVVLSSESTIKEISSFLGIKNTQSLLQPSKFGNLWQGNSMFGTKNTSISSKSLGRYKKVKGDKSISIVQHLLGRELDEFGYEKDMDFQVSSLQGLSAKIAYAITHVIREVKYELMKWKIIQFRNRLIKQAKSSQ